MIIIIMNDDGNAYSSHVRVNIVVYIKHVCIAVATKSTISGLLPVRRQMSLHKTRSLIPW